VLQYVAVYCIMLQCISYAGVNAQLDKFRAVDDRRIFCVVNRAAIRHVPHVIHMRFSYASNVYDVWFVIHTRILIRMRIS